MASVQNISVQTIKKACRSMARRLIEEHKKTGRPLVIWENGKVVKISAREAELRLNPKKKMIAKDVAGDVIDSLPKRVKMDDIIHALSVRARFQDSGGAA